MNTIEFIQKWRRALTAYGTPVDFADNTTYRCLTIEFNGKPYPFVISKAINYERRRQLMAQQKPYLPKKDAPSEWNRSANCFLCENVAQAFDAMYGLDENDNLIEDCADYFILPNRYPSQIGHSLLVPKKHDDTTNRTKELRVEEGKTRGNIITIEDLESVLDACDRNNMAAIRNHVLDGMSIPNHDHYHLMFNWTPGLSIVEYVLENLRRTEYHEEIMLTDNTPFETLVIEGGAPDIAAPILEKMELSDEVYTIVYFKGNLLISPRIKEAVGDARIDVHGYGLAGLAIHSIGSEDYGSFLSDAMKFMPKKGEYDWSRFIE